MSKGNFKAGVIRLETNKARRGYLPCIICDGKKKIETDYAGWIKCPVCHGEGTVTIAQWSRNKAIRAAHDQRVENKKVDLPPAPKD